MKTGIGALVVGLGYLAEALLRNNNIFSNSALKVADLEARKATLTAQINKLNSAIDTSTDAILDNIKASELTLAIKKGIVELEEQIANRKRTNINSIIDETRNILLQQAVLNKMSELDLIRLKFGDEFVKQNKELIDIYITEKATLAALTAAKKDNINLVKEELSLREQLIGKLSEYQEKTIEMQSIESERANLILGQISQVTSAWKTMYQTKMRNEIDTLKQTSAYRNADSERRMDMEEKITREYANNAKAMFYVEKASKLADVYLNTASAQMKSVALFPATGGQPWYSIIGAMGLVQAGVVMATPAPQAFAKGGDFVTNKPELIMVGEAGREHVKITPVDRPESRALKDSGITINISAPLVDETVIDHIIPAIQKAQRMNLA